MTILNDNRQIVVLGAGGHASVIIAELIRQNHPILGITDVKLNKGDKKLENKQKHCAEDANKSSEFCVKLTEAVANGTGLDFLKENNIEQMVKDK